MSFNPNAGHFIGVREIIIGIDNKLTTLPYGRYALLNEGGRFLVNELKRNVHVWEKRKKGTHMRDTIGIMPSAPNEIKVVVPKPYAQIENDRPGEKPGHGPHNFADRSEEAFLKYFSSRIRRYYDKVATTGTSQPTRLF